MVEGRVLDNLKTPVASSRFSTGGSRAPGAAERLTTSSHQERPPERHVRMVDVSRVIPLGADDEF